VDHLAFREVRPHELAVDPALHRHRGERGDGAQGGEVDVQIAAAGGRDDDRDRPRWLSRRAAARSLALGCLALATMGNPGSDADQTGEHDENDPDPTSATTARRPNCRIFFSTEFLHAVLRRFIKDGRAVRFIPA
jgi:hypothetical protein